MNTDFSPGVFTDNLGRIEKDKVSNSVQLF